MKGIRFESVSYCYPGEKRPALDEISFEIASGNFVLVVGPTGAGKSTLLRACNGLVPHFSGGTFAGRVLVEGRDTLERAPRYLSDVVAFVPQDPGASFVMGIVEDEIAYAMENLAVPAHAMRTRVEELLDLLALEPLRNRSVQELSGGERQRLAIAAALAPGARMLLLDEPTSQLDPQGAEDVLAALQRFVHDIGMTVVIAEHRLERVAGFADLALGFTAPGRVELGSTEEIVAELGLGPPVARLGRRFGWQPVPLTVREARRSLGPVKVSPSREKVRHERPGPHDLQVQGLVASYGGLPVVRIDRLELEAGRVTAIIGRNGAGKTTLLRCLAGLHAPDEGWTRWRGARPVPGQDVALCPQAPDDLLFRETVAAEVGSDRIMSALGLDADAPAHPRDLSAGRRALVAIAAIAATKAPVLAFDEPTRGLDFECKNSLNSFLHAEADGGRTILMATHDVELVAQCADRVLMMAAGEVVADGTPRDVLSHSSVFSPQVARASDGMWLTVDEAVAELAPVT